MTYQDVSKLVKSIGLPYAYDHFDLSDDEERRPPFICFIYPGSDDFSADNTNYISIRQLQIELYTDNKDFELERKVELALNGAGLPYTAEGGYLSDEQMYMQTYTTEVLISG